MIPSTLSRLMTGRREWRADHVACVAAALAVTTHELIDERDSAFGVDPECVDRLAALTRANDDLINENTRLKYVLREMDSRVRLTERAQAQRALTHVNSIRKVCRDLDAVVSSLQTLLRAAECLVAPIEASPREVAPPAE